MPESLLLEQSKQNCSSSQQQTTHVPHSTRIRILSLFIFFLFIFLFLLGLFSLYYSLIVDNWAPENTVVVNNNWMLVHNGIVVDNRVVHCDWVHVDGMVMVHMAMTKRKPACMMESVSQLMSEMSWTMVVVSCECWSGKESGENDTCLGEHFWLVQKRKGGVIGQTARSLCYNCF
jgi:hypothetical protein